METHFLNLGGGPWSRLEPRCFGEAWPASPPANTKSAKCQNTRSKQGQGGGFGGRGRAERHRGVHTVSTTLLYPSEVK